MRRKTRITIYTSSNQVKKLAEKFSHVADPIEIYQDTSYFEVSNLYSDTETYTVLMKNIKDNNFEYSYAEYREYTNKEMAQSEYFHVDTPYPWEQDPEQDAEYYGTEFSYTQGQTCICCRNIIGNLKINTKKMKKLHFATIVPEYIVSNFTKNIIEEHGLTGCKFNLVEDSKGRESEPYFQLQVTSRLPPISEKVRIQKADFDVQQCVSCPYIGFRRSEFIYEAEVFGEQMDFNLTYERFDGRKTNDLIVSKKVRELFLKNKIKVHRFEPIRFI